MKADQRCRLAVLACIGFCTEKQKGRKINQTDKMV